MKTFCAAIARALGINSSNVKIRGRRAGNGRNLEELYRRVLADSVTIDYEVTQRNTTAANMLDIITSSSTTSGSIAIALLAGGYPVTASPPVVLVDTSPTFRPTLAPIKPSLNGGAIAGIVIAVLIAASLMVAGAWYALVHRVKSGDVIPPPRRPIGGVNAMIPARV